MVMLPASTEGRCRTSVALGRRHRSRCAEPGQRAADPRTFDPDAAGAGCRGEWAVCQAILPAGLNANWSVM